MSIANHLDTSEVALLELEILFTIVATGAWGGFVSYLIKADKKSTKNINKGIMSCLTQVVVSCFTSFLLSAVAIEKNCSFNIVLLAAGLGGVFAGPILKVFGELVKRFLEDYNILKR
ncbi:phage holin family protein [Pseudocitrobacter cyperus]|uniref:Phage holin family protein n=1 Tax=Pseudocitrobacter cyperus TaxID=3112843 RepID=A0ABV0HI46_9ENTR